jgi:TonB family protein
MLFDIDGARPETPRVATVLPRWASVSISIGGHAVLALAVLLAIRFGPTTTTAKVLLPETTRNTVRYVDMRPTVDRVRPPRPMAEASDIDRRAATRVRPPDAELPTPYSRGNTPDKVVGAPAEPPADPMPPGSAADPTSAPPNATKPLATKVLPSLPATSPSTSTRPGLGAALRDIQRVLQEENNYQNPRGGAADQEPDISFDSKGVEFGPWLRRFVAKVKRNWFIPQAAWFQKGRVVITFNVHRDGRITDLTIIRSSESEPLDSAAFNALRLSSPLLPLPAEYPLDKAFFTVTFHYNEGSD